MKFTLLSSMRLCAALVAIASLALSGCESMSLSSLSKRIDYKSAAVAPTLDLPPDLTTPRYDDRFAVNSASGAAAQAAMQPKGSAVVLPSNPDAKIVRGGTERWLVVRATPDEAWNVVRQFWTDNGFVIASDQPALGVMETDWAENRADIPQDFLRQYVGKYIDAFYTTYKRDKFRTRVERGSEQGTTEIYISHRGMEQVPTTKIDGVQGAGFAWALMPPNPNLEAEMLSRLMMRFGTPEAQAVAATAPSAAVGGPERARLTVADGVPRLYVDDPFDRAWRRVGLALDRTGFTVVDRDRSNGVYYVRYSDPDTDMARKDKEKGFLQKLMFWKSDDKDKPEQYRILVTEQTPQSVVSVEDPTGKPDKSGSSEKILALLKDQLK